MRRLLRRVRYLITARRADAELREELESHRAMRQRELERSGLDARAAFAASRRALGNELLAREDARAAWIGRRFDELRQDVRYGLRGFARNPGLSAVTGAILALGIGANAGVFAVVDALLVRRLPVPQPEQLFTVKVVNAKSTDDAFSYQAFVDFRAAASSSAQIFAASSAERIPIFIEGQAETVQRTLVSGNYFSALRVTSALGRTFSAEDDRLPPSGFVAVLSDAYWRRRFARDPSVVGRSFTHKDQVFTVIGVARPGFDGQSVGEATDVWLPLTAQPGAPAHAWIGHSWTWLRVLGRWTAAGSHARAAHSLEPVFERIRADAVAQAKGASDREGWLASRLLVEDASRGLSRLRPRFATPLRVAAAIVACVLLIACANVATLMLERGRARRREVALRLGIGASRARLIRQLLTEALVLSALAAAAGLLLSQAVSRALVALLTGGRDVGPLHTPIDVRLLAFTAAVSLLATALFGLLPALRSTRAELAPALKASPASAAAPRRSRLGAGLVAAQLAISLVLLTAAGLFVRTLTSLARIELGFEPDSVLVFRLEWTGPPAEDARRQAYGRLLERTHGLPGVQAASLCAFPLFAGGLWGNRVTVEGYTPAPDEAPRTFANAVSPRYFEVLGMPLLRGRGFSERDGASAPRVAMVNEAFAARYFGRTDVLGLRVGLGAPAPHMMEIVGVVRDAKYLDVREQSRSMLYVPYTQHAGGLRILEIKRAAGAPQSAAELLRALASAEPGLGVVEVMALRSLVERSTAAERMTARVASVFGVFALALAAAGLYGVVAYAVRLRTSEIGIRMALGATAGQVVRLVLRQSVLLIASGLAMGVPAALLMARAVAAQLYGLQPTDPAAFGTAAGVLVSAAALAAYLPARRAARLHPALTLRHE
jgi:predicted permease